MSEEMKNQSQAGSFPDESSSDNAEEKKSSSDSGGTDSKDDSSNSDKSKDNKSGSSDSKESSGGADSKGSGKSSSSSSGLAVGDAAGVMHDKESKGGIDTQGQKELSKGGGILGGKGDKKNKSSLAKLAKKALMMAQAAIAAIQSFVFGTLIMLMQALLAAILAAVVAVASAIVGAVIALVTTVATAIGVSVAAAAVATFGIAFLIGAIIVGAVIVVGNSNTAVKDDVVPCEEVDMDYMEIPDGIDPQAWTNAKLIYTFFRSYGKACVSAAGGDESYDYTDEMIAGILGNWYHESHIDTTAVETVSTEPYAIGPLKLWLWQGGIEATYNWHYDMDNDKVYDDTTLNPYYLLDNGVTKEETVGVFADDSGDDTCTFEDASDSLGLGLSFANDYIDHQPIEFATKWFKKFYQSSYWSEFPSINWMGIGLGQWTNSRNIMLLNYAEGKSREWYDLDVQLMYMLGTDGKAEWVQQWKGTYTSDTYSTTVTVGTGDDAREVTYTYTNGMEYDGEPLDTAAVIAYCTDDFASNWEVCNDGSIDSRVQAAFMWYRIITEWKDGVDYTLGTGSSLWSSLESVSVTAGDVTQQSGARSCTDVYFMGNSSIAEAAVSYAWGPGQDDHNKGTLCWQHLYSTINPGDPYFMSCDRTVALAVRWSGADSDYPWGNTATQLEYLFEEDANYRAMLAGELSGGMSSDTAWWMEVDTSSAHSKEELLALLRPGDILIRNDDVSVPAGFNNTGVGHTLIYTGNEIIRRRWPTADAGYCIVSGSIDERSPSVGTFFYTDYDPNGKGYESYYVFRNMGTYVSEQGREDMSLSCAGHSNEQ